MPFRRMIGALPPSRRNLNEWRALMADHAFGRSVRGQLSCRGPLTFDRE